MRAMEVVFGQSWLDLLQSVGIVSSLLFGAYSIWREERARQIEHLFAIIGQHREIWKELYQRPELARFLHPKVNLKRSPISVHEEVFVKLLIQQLGGVHQALQVRMFVNVEGLRKDVRAFFAAPIPQAVWEKYRSLQNKEFVRFVEEAQRGG